MEIRSAAEFLQATATQVDAAIARASLAPGQEVLLQRAVQRQRSFQGVNPLSNPVSLFWLVVSAARRPMNDVGIALGAFCELYMLSLALFDDVQDEALAKTPFAEVGSPIAINSALLFLCLGLTELRLAMTAEAEPAQQLEYLRIFNEASVQAGRGQYLDLLGGSGPKEPPAVLAMEREKTSTARLFCELGAVFARHDLETVRRYRTIGEGISLVSQLVGDVADLYSGSESRDLAMGKITYPVACYLEDTGETGASRLRELCAEMPRSLPALRRLFHEAGSVRRVAVALEQVRSSVHESVAAMANEAAAHRTLLHGVDALCRGVYKLPRLANTAAFWSPKGPWHERVRELAHGFWQRMHQFQPPAAPPLVPWHVPHWVYDSEQRVVYYPDIEGQPADTLAFQAELLSIPDLKQVRALAEEHAPAVMAHELFHAWRDVAGRLTQNFWLEERVATELALAYCQSFEPTLFQRTQQLARDTVALREGELTPTGRAVLSAALSGSESAIVTGYGVSAREMAVIQLTLITELVKDLPPLAELLAKYLLVSVFPDAHVAAAN